MKQLTQSQLISLWICLIYFGIAFARIAARAMLGFLRLASEHREAQVPRELLLSVAEAASQDFALHALLTGIGFVMLGVIVIWITRNPSVR